MPEAFANLDGLLRLSHKEGVDIRRPLLRVLTDLYVQEKAHTREAEQQFMVLALRLIPAVDSATRLAVARKLSGYALTPTPILDALSRIEPEVANMIRTEQAPSIKPPIEPTPLAAPPEMECAGDSLGERFLSCDRNERAVLLVDLENNETAEPEPDLPPLPARPGAPQRLERAALQRNQQDFARELQLSLGITARIASRIVHDDSGEPLVLALRALDIAPGVLLRILLFLNPQIGESVERVFALMRLNELIEARAVDAIVASWREQAAASAAQFQPLHAVDNSRPRRESIGGQETRRPAAEPHIADSPLRHQGTT